MKMRKNEFKLNDPYNPFNLLEGTIFLDQKQYGNLQITKVNGIECNQYIFTTPKFLYPNRGQSPSVYEKNISKYSRNIPTYDTLYVFDKVDGTNIFSYTYEDAKGKKYRTYKTRMQPFLNPNSAIGNWVSKWNVCLSKYDFKSLYAMYPSYNFAFEFYSDTEHLISHERMSECDFLYAMDQQGKIMLPLMFDTDFTIPLLLEKTNNQIFEDVYLQYISYTRKYIRNIPSIRSRKQYLEKNDLIAIDKEGVMIYGLLNDIVQFVYKCKPIEIVEVQNMESANEISMEDIHVTSINCLENIESFSELESETIELLKETFTVEEIRKSMKSIKKVSMNIIKEEKSKQEIIDWYKIISSQNPSIKNNGKEIMRLASTHNFKQKIGKIYSVLSPFFENEKKK